MISPSEKAHVSLRAFEKASLRGRLVIERHAAEVRENLGNHGQDVTKNSQLDGRIQTRVFELQGINAWESLREFTALKKCVHRDYVIENAANEIRASFRAAGRPVTKDSPLDKKIKRATADRKTRAHHLNGSGKPKPT